MNDAGPPFAELMQLHPWWTVAIVYAIVMVCWGVGYTIQEMKYKEHIPNRLTRVERVNVGLIFILSPLALVCVLAGIVCIGLWKFWVFFQEDQRYDSKHSGKGNIYSGQNPFWGS